MAINLDDRYPGRANPKSVSYPQGSFKNRTSPTSKDGTYLEQDWANDLLAFFQSLMTDAGLTANGAVDTVTSSQYFDALQSVISDRSIIVLPTAPATQSAGTIFVEDREQILRWKTIGAFTGYASSEVGCFAWGTQPTPRPFEIDLIGQTIDKTVAKYAALHAWATAAGLFVSSGTWTAGTYFFAEMGGNLFKVPDMRDMFIRATGTDIDTANARGLGSGQGSANIAHSHDVSTYAGSGAASYGAGAISQAQSGANAVLTGVSGFGVQTEGSAESRPVNVALNPRIIL